VAYNFTVRQPVHANEHLLWYFGSKDIGVAHTLARRFFWQENILWKEDFEMENGQDAEHRLLTVVLSEKDDVVNVEAVRQYLTDCSPAGSSMSNGTISKANGNKANGKKAKAEWDFVDEKLGSIGVKSWSKSWIKVVWFEGFHHADVFDVKKARQSVAAMLRAYPKDGKKEISWGKGSDIE